MKATYKALAVLFVLGLVKLPLEEHTTHTLREHRLLSRPIDLSFRENLGQMGFAASLGGLRSLVASVTYLQAYSAFENVDWGKVDSLFQLTTRLQPGYEKYWEEGSWHMAYNAASSYLYHTKKPRAIRHQLARDHVQRGIEILEEGLKFSPHSGILWAKLGEIYARRGLNSLNETFETLDAQKAGDCFLLAAENGALQVYERLGAYELVKTHDVRSHRRAYEVLVRNYWENKRTPALIHNLKVLEELLSIPSPQRIRDEDPIKVSPKKQVR
jgi:hypothetical protein